MNLEQWYRTYIDGDGVQVLPAPASAATSASLPAAGVAPARPPLHGEAR
jgi:hypothetical protein